MMSKTNLWCFY